MQSVYISIGYLLVLCRMPAYNCSVYLFTSFNNLGSFIVNWFQKKNWNLNKFRFQLFWKHFISLVLFHVNIMSYQQSTLSVFINSFCECLKLVTNLLHNDFDGVTMWFDFCKISTTTTRVILLCQCTIYQCINIFSHFRLVILITKLKKKSHSKSVTVSVRVTIFIQLR